MADKRTPEQQLVDDIAAFQHDPLGFVLYAFPWGKAGTALAKKKGPRKWQREVLAEIGEKLRAGAIGVTEAIQLATASGHGIGKSALVSFIVLWAISTHEDTRGVVTANTDGQLRSKTWPEVTKWHQMLICRHWFECTATAIYSKCPGHEKTWRIDAVPWSDTNTEAFAGLHNEGKRILLVFDEASAISDKIWEVSEGALTDANTEIIWAVFGNPTRNTGRFHACFHRMRHRWSCRQIDSRTVEDTNPEQARKWVEDYGEDSDFVRVRVRGVFPRAGSLQFIGRDLVDGAMKRPTPIVGHSSQRTAVVGVDVARFGDDQSVIRTRIGRDARSIGPKKFRGLDTMQLAAHVAAHIQELVRLGFKVVTFVDGGGIGGGVIDRLRQLQYDVTEVLFGSAATDSKKYANKAAEMWGRGREWLATGVIDDDEQLATDCTGREYGYNDASQIVLEKKADMKKRGLASPDDADALFLTFAEDVPEFASPGLPGLPHVARRAPDHRPY